ncbi:GntR family transcriptional regulator [Mycobacterium sp.]|uniref:GntR family transcriptional regulator n=1 Tax=Mycobacterium sp. TaxID=1785 RepID=UPI002C65FCF8|nr:GntR family transcriptional regulator [Mycobacterium sp.]HKP42739.1 GntR family transcriptional regulator [Mycobacterium sp.]
MSTPRYATLAETLAKSIAEGALPIGTQLPRETELARVHHVSRATVRSAMLVLEQQGLVSRTRKRGTIVEAAAPAPRYRNTIESVHDLVQYAHHTRRLVKDIREVACPANISRRTGWTTGRPIVAATLVRETAPPQRRPIAWTRAFIDTTLTDELAAAIVTEHGLLSDLVSPLIGRFTDSVDQVITAGCMDLEVAHVLRGDPGQPALLIERLYRDATRSPFLYTHSAHAHDQFEYRSSLRLRSDDNAG